MTIKIVKNIKGKTEFKKILDQIYSNREFRKELADNDMFWFYSIYFAHYIKYQTAEFQKEIISLVSDEKIKVVAITSFRNSAKSTICALILPIWATVGKWKKKYVVIVCQTQARARESLANLRAELEIMGILVEDYQPREGKNDKWNEEAIVLPKYGVKICAVSIGESIRGMRYKQYRPDLVICDDLEDVNSCQNEDNRKKLWEFVNGELIPAGDDKAKYIFIGNKVHNDSLMIKLKKAIESGKLKGVYREYPLIDSYGKIAWPGKFPNMKAIEELKGRYASEIDYLREQMLIILPDGDTIIKPEDIHYYDSLPKKRPEFVFLSIDPAYSLEKTADKTAITKIYVYKIEGRLLFYVVPPIVNQKMETNDLINKIKEIMAGIEKEIIVKIFVEKVGGQKTIIDMLQFVGIPAEGVEIGGKDKKIRLSSIAPWIKNGQILFPTTGAEDLINQTLYFGIERYDDAVDALTLGINEIIKRENQPVNTGLMITLNEPYIDTMVRHSLKNNLKLFSFRSDNKDWADKDDESIFKKYKMRNPHRILN